MSLSAANDSLAIERLVGSGVVLKGTDFVLTAAHVAFDNFRATDGSAALNDTVLLRAGRRPTAVQGQLYERSVSNQANAFRFMDETIKEPGNPNRVAVDAGFDVALISFPGLQSLGVGHLLSTKSGNELIGDNTVIAGYGLSAYGEFGNDVLDVEDGYLRWGMNRFEATDTALTSARQGAGFRL